MKNRVLLLDGNLLMFKSFFATSKPDNKYWFYNGKHVGGVRVFLNTLSSVINYLKPTHMLIAFDTDSHTFRHDSYKEYKGTRTKVDETIFQQLKYVKHFLDLLNIKRLEIQGFEADDIIASSYKLFNPNDSQIFIYSSDKDMFQMLDFSNIDIVTKNTKTKQFDHLNKDNFFAYFGIEPSQIVDYKAIAGDNSDNLPGVKGIGHKTAIKLLNEYHSFHNIFNNLNELSPSIQQKFLDSKDIAEKCKFLAQLRYDVPLNMYDFDLKLNITKVNDKDLIAEFGAENVLERFYKTW
ncbi:probable 5'-3' exodeoxyribonuclease [Mycoplasmopsis californica]|uniref:5'-3' exonuclease n=1 Tax=Mycoplasmopsis equigenitalium TaxID=114883 RepID=A0ABY5J4D9_9BACT|nr:5'-3' exonuclease [Mycoplasmopsis equigenitalium]UUD36820.1 5'-3' exonuclease [Mycoplasmopsis equigenitalium]VEU69883.1 probable 5'-3' exodeoxyribonuclease [Mycoplasmopsis californica]